MGNTKISIIVPSYNQGRFLEDTLQSIIDQHYDDVEIIVMDGGSTDNSVEVIKNLKSISPTGNQKRRRSEQCHQ